MSELLGNGTSTGFGPQTVIQTTEGPIPVEWLSTTHHVITRDHGPQPILSIDLLVLRALDGDYLPLIEIAAEAFQSNIPDHPLLLPPHHRILLEGEDIELHFGMDAALCHCADLLDGGRVTRRNIAREMALYGVLLPNHEVINANGLWVETTKIEADSAHVSLDTLNPNIFAKLRLKDGAHQLAHPCLEAWEGRLLARNHASTMPLQLTDVA